MSNKSTQGTTPNISGTPKNIPTGKISEAKNQVPTMNTPPPPPPKSKE